MPTIIKSFQKFKPEYKDLFDKFSKHLSDLEQMVVDKYNKPEYTSLWNVRPYEMHKKVEIEKMQITRHVRHALFEIYNMAMEHHIVISKEDEIKNAE